MTHINTALLKTEGKHFNKLYGQPLTRKETKALKQHKAALARNEKLGIKKQHVTGRKIVDVVIHPDDVMIPVYEDGPQHPYVQKLIEANGPHPAMKRPEYQLAAAIASQHNIFIEEAH